VHANRDQKSTKKSFRPSWRQQEALIMHPLAVAAMASAERADHPDGWPEGRCLEARRKRIMTAPPITFDVDDSNICKVEVNGECKGNGNSNGPVDNNNNNNYNLAMTTMTKMGGGQDRSVKVGR
jgi:hypothetical protein